MLDSLTHLVSGSPVTYAIVLLTATFDVLFPILPAETVLIGSAVIAAHGGLSIWLLVPAAAIGCRKTRVWSRHSARSAGA